MGGRSRLRVMVLKAGKAVKTWGVAAAVPRRGVVIGEYAAAIFIPSTE